MQQFPVAVQFQDQGGEPARETGGKASSLEQRTVLKSAMKLCCSSVNLTYRRCLIIYSNLDVGFVTVQPNQFFKQLSCLRGIAGYIYVENLGLLHGSQRLRLPRRNEGIGLPS